MTDFIIGGSPFEMPESAAAEDYAKTPSTQSQLPNMLGTASSTLFGQRAAERGTAPDATRLDVGIGAGLAYQQFGDQADQDWMPKPSTEDLLPADEINKQFAPIGPDGKPVSITDKPMTATLGKIIGRQKTAAMESQSIVERNAQTHSWPVNFAIESAAFMMDPVNLAAGFIPGIGEAVAMTQLGRMGLTGLGARTAARVAAGASAGAAAMVPLSALKMALSPEEASDYGMRDGLRDIFYGAAFGAGIHAGLFGAARETGLLRPDAIMAPPPLPEAQIPASVTAFSLARESALRERFENEVHPAHVDLAEAGFTHDEIGGLARNGMADAEGRMTPDMYETWRGLHEEYQTTPPDATVPRDTWLPESATGKVDTMRVGISEAVDGRPMDVSPVSEVARAEYLASIAWAKGLTESEILARLPGVSTRPTAAQRARARQILSDNLLASGRVVEPAPEGPGRSISTIMRDEDVTAERAQEIQMAEILAASARNAALKMSGQAQTRRAPTPAEVSQHLRDQARTGYATGIPNADMAQMGEELYGSSNPPRDEMSPGGTAPMPKATATPTAAPVPSGVKGASAAGKTVQRKEIYGAIQNADVLHLRPVLEMLQALPHDEALAITADMERSADGVTPRQAAHFLRRALQGDMEPLERFERAGGVSRGEPPAPEIKPGVDNASNAITEVRAGVEPASEPPAYVTEPPTPGVPTKGGGAGNAGREGAGGAEGQPGAVKPDPDMLEAERRLAAVQEHLTPEDMASIEQATRDQAMAEDKASGIDEAGACLKGQL